MKDIGHTGPGPTLLQQDLLTCSSERPCFPIGSHSCVLEVRTSTHLFKGHESIHNGAKPERCRPLCKPTSPCREEGVRLHGEGQGRKGKGVRCSWLLGLPAGLKAALPSDSLRGRGMGVGEGGAVTQRRRGSHRALGGTGASRWKEPQGSRGQQAGQLLVGGARAAVLCCLAPHSQMEVQGVLGMRRCSRQTGPTDRTGAPYSAGLGHVRSVPPSLAVYTPQRLISRRGTPTKALSSLRRRRQLPAPAMVIWGLRPCLPATVCSHLSTWDSWSLAPCRSLSCSFSPILFHCDPGCHGNTAAGTRWWLGAGSRTAAAASIAISDARHLQGLVAGPHLGGPQGLRRPHGLLLSGRWGEGADCGSESSVLGGVAL